MPFPANVVITPVRDGAAYVLSQLKKSQMTQVDEMLDAASEAVKVILGDGPDAAMNRFNRKPDGPKDGSGEVNKD